MILAAWRWFWPVSFTRWVGCPARGRWRACSYRRRWAGVMMIAGVAPWYQGRTLLPVLGKVAATRYTDRVGPAGLRAVPGRLRRGTRTTWRTGSARCCAGSAPPGPGAVVLEFVRRDALAALVPALPIPATRISRRCRSGAAKTGCPGWSSCTARTS